MRLADAFRKIRAVAWKEMLQSSRDPLTLGMLLGVPAMMLLLYGYALSFDVRHIALAVQDLDRSTRSRELLDSFTRSGCFDAVADLDAGADVTRMLESQQARAILVIPPDFTRDLQRGEDVALQLLIDGTDSQTASTLMTYAEGVAREMNLRILAETPELRSAGQRAAIDVAARVWFNPELKSTHFLVPGLIGFILMLTAVLSTALSVVREKERGTMDQLKLTALDASQLLLGKTLPYLVISLLASVVILLTARVLFGVVVQGSYLDLFLITLVYLIGALGFGLLVSSFANSQAMAFQVGTLLSMLPAIFLSGFIFPIRSMPPVLQTMTLAVPARYFLVMLRGVILKGAPLSEYLHPFWFLCAYGAAVMAVAWIRLTRERT